MAGLGGTDAAGGTGGADGAGGGVGFSVSSFIFTSAGIPLRVYHHSAV
jgi:hypothetical protein